MDVAAIGRCFSRQPLRQREGEGAVAECIQLLRQGGAIGAGEKDDFLVIRFLNEGLAVGAAAMTVSTNIRRRPVVFFSAPWNSCHFTAVEGSK
jgi:hypothetical protein